jgi:hypothetical protein
MSKSKSLKSKKCQYGGHIKPLSEFSQKKNGEYYGSCDECRVVMKSRNRKNNNIKNKGDNRKPETLSGFDPTKPINLKNLLYIGQWTRDETAKLWYCITTYTSAPHYYPISRVYADFFPERSRVSCSKMRAELEEFARNLKTNDPVEMTKEFDKYMAGDRKYRKDGLKSV